MLRIDRIMEKALAEKVTHLSAYLKSALANPSMVHNTLKAEDIEVRDTDILFKISDKVVVAEVMITLNRNVDIDEMVEYHDAGITVNIGLWNTFYYLKQN